MPGRDGLAPELDVDYFSIVADSLAAPTDAKRRLPAGERWGLMSAVLGNKSNRNEFVSRFWLAGFPPKPRPGEPVPPLDPMRLRSLQELVRSGEHGALSWDAARHAYRQARERVDALTC